METMFKDIYRNKRVLVTGHTGFKGSWLSLWLSHLGADVSGFSLAEPPSEPDHFTLLEIGIDSIQGDIRDGEKIKHLFKDLRPEIVFHLAAQPIVRLSYSDPAGTFSSNLMGTINVFEAARAVGSVNAMVIITSDKCYENSERQRGYREDDPMGGFDPYSASKGCAELATACWRNSFFNPESYGIRHRTLVASCRSGNVIGGGDWAADRLIPDLVRGAAANERVQIRNPRSVRPWQHVLDPLGGYLLVGQGLLDGNKECAGAWNFGPADEGCVPVGVIAEEAKKTWPKIEFEKMSHPDQPHEAALLRLDCSKARTRLRWLPVWDMKNAVSMAVEWYRLFYEQKKVSSRETLLHYFDDAKSGGVSWMRQ